MPMIHDILCLETLIIIFEQMLKINKALIHSRVTISTKYATNWRKNGKVYNKNRLILLKY